MLAFLKTLASNLVGPAKGSHPRENNGCGVATAALLIRVANVDSDMSDARRHKLHAVLKSHLGCDDTATLRLIETATDVSSAAVDLYHFTNLITRLADEEERCRIVQMMWEVLFADGAVSPLENNIVWRAADLLGVPSRQRVTLRHRIAVQSASAMC